MTVLSMDEWVQSHMSIGCSQHTAGCLQDAFRAGAYQAHSLAACLTAEGRRSVSMVCDDVAVLRKALTRIHGTSEEVKVLRREASAALDRLGDRAWAGVGGDEDVGADEGSADPEILDGMLRGVVGALALTVEKLCAANGGRYGVEAVELPMVLAEVCKGIRGERGPEGSSR